MGWGGTSAGDKPGFLASSTASGCEATMSVVRTRVHRGKPLWRREFVARSRAGEGRAETSGIVRSRGVRRSKCLIEAVFGSVRGVSEEPGMMQCIGQDPCRTPLSASPARVSQGSWTVRA
jgi:hypothetical protein